MKWFIRLFRRDRPTTFSRFLAVHIVHASRTGTLR